MRITLRKTLGTALLLMALAVLLPGQSQALQFSGSRASFFSNDFVDWGAAFPGVDAAIVANGSSAASHTYGVGVTVANPEGDDFLRFDFNFINLDFGGSDPLFIALDGTGPLVITFERPIFAAGAQIAPNNNELPFIAKIAAYNAEGLSLGFFEQEYEKNNPLVPTNFMGVFDPLMSITAIQFSVEMVDGDFFSPGDFFINQLDFLVSPPCTPCPPVPLPGSLLLMGPVLLGLAGWRNFRKK